MPLNSFSISYPRFQMNLLVDLYASISRLPHLSEDKLVSCGLHQDEINRELPHEFTSEMVCEAIRRNGFSMARGPDGIFHLKRLAPMPSAPSLTIQPLCQVERHSHPLEALFHYSYSEARKKTYLCSFLLPYVLTLHPLQGYRNYYDFPMKWEGIMFSCSSSTFSI